MQAAHADRVPWQGIVYCCVWSICAKALVRWPISFVTVTALLLALVLCPTLISGIYSVLLTSHKGVVQIVEVQGTDERR